MKTWKQKWVAVLLVLCCLLGSLTGCEEASARSAQNAGNYSIGAESQTGRSAPQVQAVVSSTLDEVPEYSGAPYIVLADNQPDFTDEEKIAEAFEYYSELDELGRCGAAYACLGQELMPTEPRGEIGLIKPTGWHTVKYDFVDGKYLYNRCHLIGFQLAGENANPQNLITGTRYMNTEGMLPFENMAADYIKETNYHVLYRVTPVFEGENLVAKGVQMEAYSVEDQGSGICFNVFVYNVQPGVAIDYTNGESTESNEEKGASAADNDAEQTYILNVSTRKFHLPDCSSVEQMDENNRRKYTGSREALVEEGYEPCKRCNPLSN